MWRFHATISRLLPTTLRWCSQNKPYELTSADEQQIDKIIDAYQAFWDHIRFRKGWAKPAFTYEDVEIPMGIAAEYVVRIRRELDKRNPGMKMRMVDGNAQTYLQNASKSDTEKETFVRDLVHASLKDATGYVENLTKETVDLMLSKMEVSSLTSEQLEVLRTNMQLSACDSIDTDIRENKEAAQAEESSTDTSKSCQEAEPILALAPKIG